MSRLVSVNTKIQQLEGLVDTRDVTDRENSFIKSVALLTHGGVIISILSERQVAWVEDIWQRHWGEQ